MLPKTYEATNIEEFEEILMEIVMRKVKEVVGDKKIRIVIGGELYE